MKRIQFFFLLVFQFSYSLKGSSNKGPSYLSTEDPNLPLDIKYQGEYKNEDLGAQVISLANGSFQAVIFPNGLPGDGWDQKNKTLMDGKLMDEKVLLTSCNGPRAYLDHNPDLFSATQLFLPTRQQSLTGMILPDGQLILKFFEEKKEARLRKIVRASPTIGTPPPEGAIILFNGTNTDSFIGGRQDLKTKNLHTDG